MNLITNELFNDGEHILYVNGEFRDDSDIGKLMHDFSCWDPDEMNYDLMRDATRYFKEDPKGVAFMCRTFEEIRNEGIAQGIEQGIAQGMAQGIAQGIEQGMAQGMAQGIEQGMAQGMARGIEQNRLKSISSLMNTMKLSARDAMNALMIPPEEQADLLAKLTA